MLKSQKLLAELAAEIQFVFFSTDLIFDGRKGKLRRDGRPNPLHIYGETKVAAEEIVLKNPRHLVVRTSINGGVSRAGNRGFNEQLRRVAASRAGDDAVHGRISLADSGGRDGARGLGIGGEKLRGNFHVAGAEKLSRWQIGELLVKRWPEIKQKSNPARRRIFAGPPRALDTSLNISKAQKVLSKPLPGLGEWLAANPGEPF
jgi:dTDP-4-dehydrorhamnose reductase